MLFRADCEDPNKQSEPETNTWNIFLIINVNGKYWPGLLNKQGKEKF